MGKSFQALFSKGLGIIPKMKTGRFGGQPERSVFRCGTPPDLLALQGNPGQPTPFFASVATLAMLAWTAPKRCCPLYRDGAVFA